MSSDRPRRKVRGGSLDMSWELKARQKIQSSNVLNSLINHVNGENKLEASQVSAGLGLLRKTLPDLSSTTLSGDAEKPIRHKVEVVFVSAKD